VPHLRGRHRGYPFLNEDMTGFLSGLFGTAGVADPSQLQRQQNGSPPSKAKYQHSEFSLSGETGSFCALFFCYLSVIPFLFVFLYHAFPTTILSVVALLALCSFIPCIFNRGDQVVTEPVGPLLAASMLACTILVFLGSMHLYWAHVQPMRALMLSREYTGVYPQLPSVAFADAAFLQFTGNTSVAVNQGVNVKTLDAGFNTFCAAPIINHDSSGRIEFWAVGVDCCGDHHHGKFECDDAGIAGAKNGYVMQDPDDPLFDAIGKYLAPPIIRRDIFLQAIAKAEHTRNLVTSKEPLLVRWTKLKKQDIIAVKVMNITICCIVNTVLSLGMALFLARIVHHFGELRAAHRHEQYGTEHQDVSARLNEFIHSLDEDFENVELSAVKSKVERPPLVWEDTLLMGIVVPYIVMMLCVLLTTYTGCMRNGHLVYAPFYTILGVMILALLATPNRVMNGLFLLLVSLVGLYIGFENYNSNMFHYCSIEGRRSYSDVPADASTEVYRDAGILNFGANSYLSQNHSVGFVYKNVVYCAAPILSRASGCGDEAKVALLQNSNSAALALPGTPVSFLQRISRMHSTLAVDDDEGDESAPTVPATPAQCKTVAPQRVEFWAIGTECCNARKEFRCDGGQDKNAHSAVIVRDTPGEEEPGGEREQFSKAIAQAVAAYDLPGTKQPVMIRWGADPEALQSTWKTTAGGVILLTAMIGFLSILLVGLGSFWYMRRERRREKREELAEKAKEQELEREQNSSSFLPLGGFFTKAREQLRV